MRGEFNSAKAVHEVVPNLVPKPIAWGTLSQDVNIHFILCVFHGTNHQSISAIHFAESVAKLHQKSAAPDNKFGFSITTHIGTLAQNNARTTSWEAYFSINFSQLLHLEKAIQRSDNLELENLSNAMLTKVIPRLLRPLETDGRSVIPVLLHGDISYNNLSASLKTKRPIVFDSAAFYGHNEYDLRNVALGLPGIEFLEVYNETIPVSDPKEDFQDRMVLYGLRDYLHESCLHPGDKIFREQLVAGMKVLVEKFPGGYEAWLEMVEGFKTMMEDEI